MKKDGETYQSRICFTKVKFLVDSGDLPTLIGNILEKKNMYIYQTYVCRAMIRGSEENDVPYNNWQTLYM